MAKFCGNCGTQLDDNARMCGQCGMPLDDSLTKIAGLKPQDSKKRSKTKKRIRAVTAFVIIIAVIVGGLNIASNFVGIKSLVRKVMTAYRDYDIDSLVLLSSDVYYYDDDETYVENYFENSVGNNLDSFESSVGHNYKFSYKIEEIYRLSERRQNEILKNVGYSYPNFDMGLIKEISVAEVLVTAKQGSKSIDRDVTITMTKEGSDWKILYIE